MAGIADMIVGSALESAQKAPDISGSITKGAELAQTIQNMQVQREQMDKQKQELQMQKAVAVTDTLKIAASSKDPKLKNFLLKNVMPGKIKALGMEEFFPPQTMEMIQTSDAVQQKILGLQFDLDEKVRSGQMTGAQAYAEAQRILADPEELAMLDTDQLFEAQKFKNSEEGKSARAEQMARASLGKQIQGQQAAGVVEQSKKANDLYTAYKAAGGAAGTKSRIGKLRDVRNQLESGAIKFGTLGKNIPYGANLDVLARIDPKAKAAIDTVRSSINVKMRTGDPNPTQNQIEQIYNQAIDPRLSNKENVEKLDREIRAEEEAERNAQDLFRANGISVAPAAKASVKASGGSEPWRAQVQSKKAAFGKLTPENKVRFLEGLQKILNVPLEDIKKELGVK